MIILAIIALFFFGYLLAFIFDEFRVKLPVNVILFRITRRIKDLKNLNWVEYEDEALQALYFHCDLGDKIGEMLDDPLTTYSDWRAIIPVCKYADEWFKRTHPYIKKIASKEDLVKRLMA